MGWNWGGLPWLWLGRLVSFGIRVVLHICMSMAFGLGLRIAGIIYGNGMRRLSEPVVCLRSERNMVLDLECLLAYSVVGRYHLFCCHCDAVLIMPFWQKNLGQVGGREYPKKDKRVRRPAPTSLLAPRGAPFAVEISFRPPYYQDGSNLRVSVNPRLVVSPAIC